MSLADCRSRDAIFFTNMSTLDQAIVHHQAGRLREAEELYRKLLASEPQHPDALHLLGVLSLQSGHPEVAVDLIDQAIAVNPQVPDYQNNRGEALRMLRRWHEAVCAYEQALRLRPDYAEALHNLGLALEAVGQLDQAIETFNRALALTPDAETYRSLGDALRKQCRLEEAIIAYERALALAPAFAHAANNLGATLRTVHKLPEAIAMLERAVSLSVDYTEAHYNLGIALAEYGQLDRAVSAYEHALATKADFPEALYNLGIVLARQGKAAEAAEAFRRAVTLVPNFAEAYHNLSIALQKQGHLGEAIAAAKREVTLNQDSEAYNNLGVALQNQASLREAISSYRTALRLAPENALAHSNLLLCLNYVPDANPQEVFNEHEQWRKQHCAGFSKNIGPYANFPDPDRPLHIGYVSPDLRTSTVAIFVEPILRTHDPSMFRIFCYANVAQSDDVTRRLQKLGHEWREIALLSDDKVTEQIRKDGIDILIDLAGHTVGNRLLVFARKPAPVQATYLGYPNTTGLHAIDYRLTDAWADPPGRTERLHTERLARLPNGFHCYEPPRNSPAVTELPALSTGHITFASFNIAAKVNDRVLTSWSNILKALPMSRLLLKSRQYADNELRNRFREIFERNGVSRDRVEMIGWTQTTKEHLQLYNNVDIGLDTFPYNGTTTTCDALWMGVPIITLAGNIHAGRVGVSLLSNLDLPELIADNEDAYVKVAVQLATQRKQLQAWRQELRAKMLRSTLTDATKFTRTLESTYRTMWHKWCEDQNHA
jgi:protein O-GlcNAc transferase